MLEFLYVSVLVICSELFTVSQGQGLLPCSTVEHLCEMLVSPTEVAWQITKHYLFLLTAGV